MTIGRSLAPIPECRERYAGREHDTDEGDARQDDDGQHPSDRPSDPLKGQDAQEEEENGQLGEQQGEAVEQGGVPSRLPGLSAVVLALEFRGLTREDIAFPSAV